MGYSLYWNDTYQQWAGYGAIAYCDHPKCKRVIDRGLSYVCGREGYGGEHGCGLHFCEKHLNLVRFEDGYRMVCDRCAKKMKPFRKKPEHPRWIKHLLTHHSWKEWRQENPYQVQRLKRMQRAYRKKQLAKQKKQ